jgi:hypothetical protein
MPSSRATLFAGLAVASLLAAGRADAQQQALGFHVERLYPSAPGAGWVAMDALDMHGGLGGVAAVTAAYAHDPLRVKMGGSDHLTVVSSQAFVEFGFAATYERWRFHFAMDAPLVGRGTSGTAGAYTFAAPDVRQRSHPDALSDARIGLDVRLVGEEESRFRLGAGAQLFVPNGDRSDYVTDGSYRAMGRALVAGDVGAFSYAGHVGIHVRPLDDSPTPGSPQGSEMLFGAAGGARFLLGERRSTALVVGPEIYGATAFRSFFEGNGTALDGLLSGRLEGTGHVGPQLRLKVGTGVGLNQHFGAPEWRFVVSIETFGHATDPRR